MASTLPIRAVRSATCSASHSLATPSPAANLFPRRVFSTTPAASNAAEETVEDDGKPLPRWSHTPSRAKAPFSLRMNSRRPHFHINSDPAVLDKFYVGMLGEGGDQLMSEEVKWLAVTHKSFDQGRRGFNDRLAFLGKRIVQLQVSLALVQGQSQPANRAVAADSFGRVPFTHAALEGLSHLSDEGKTAYLDRMKLAGLAQRYGLNKVLRWSPRKPENLAGSGIHLVLAHTMYAIVGAISLEKGGDMANKVTQRRILHPLGLKFDLT